MEEVTNEGFTREASQQHSRAKNVPGYLFEQNFQIAQNLVAGAMLEAALISCVDYALSGPVGEMRNCTVATDHRGYRYSPYGLHTLEDIVRYLAPQLSGPRAREAEVVRR